MNKISQTISIVTLFVFGVLISNLTLADQEKQTIPTELTSASTAADTQNTVADKAKMLKNLTDRYRDAFNNEPDEITQSLIPNVYQLRQGTKVVYISADGKYF